jgi:hypothetical protein
MTIESIVGADKGTFGLFGVQVPGTDECIEVTRDIDDAWFKTAQVCSIIALCSGLIFFVVRVFKQCIIPLPCTQSLWI